MATLPSLTVLEAPLLPAPAKFQAPSAAPPKTTVETNQPADSTQDETASQQILGDHLSVPPPNAFPQFTDGDVQIISGAGQTWRLHSSTLAKYSKVLAALLDPTKVTKNPTRIQRAAGANIMWKLEMTEFKDNPNEHRLRSFKLEDKPSSKKHINLNDDVAQRRDQYHKVYNNLFKCFYNYNPDLTNDKTGAGVGCIADTVAILLAAEHLDAVDGLHIILEGHFLRLADRLWPHVAAKPERWSFMAARIRSPVLFKEAMIHVVGKLDMKGDIDQKWFASNPLRRTILKIVEKKVREIKEKKLEVERRLIEHYPQKMMHVQVGNVIPNRAAYGSDIYLWQARGIVQQYISSAYFNNLHHRGHDGGVQFYRTIGTGGEAYLGKTEDLDQWFNCFTMSGKGKVCLMEALTIVKDELKPIVQDLLYDRSQAKRNEGDDKLPWLTCAKILEDEFPWEQK